MPKPSRRPDPNEVAHAIETLTAAGAVFSLPPNQGSLSLPAAAAEIDVKPDWLREHLEEFPNRWRLPAGSMQRGERTVNVGEWRIPRRDLAAFTERQKVAGYKKEGAPVTGSIGAKKISQRDGERSGDAGLGASGSASAPGEGMAVSATCQAGQKAPECAAKGPLPGDSQSTGPDREGAGGGVATLGGGRTTMGQQERGIVTKGRASRSATDEEPWVKKTRAMLTEVPGGSH